MALPVIQEQHPAPGTWNPELFKPSAMGAFFFEMINDEEWVSIYIAARRVGRRSCPPLSLQMLDGAMAQAERGWRL